MLVGRARSAAGTLFVRFTSAPCAQLETRTAVRYDKPRSARMRSTSRIVTSARDVSPAR